MSIGEMTTSMSVYMEDFLVAAATWLMDCNMALIFVGLGCFAFAFSLFRKLVRE